MIRWELQGIGSATVRPIEGLAAVGPEALGMLCGVFCDWGYFCAAPILRDLGSLSGNIKHPSSYRGFV